jgi:hypothetical protein
VQGLQQHCNTGFLSKLGVGSFLTSESWMTCMFEVCFVCGHVACFLSHHAIPYANIYVTGKHIRITCITGRQIQIVWWECVCVRARVCMHVHTYIPSCVDAQENLIPTDVARVFLECLLVVFLASRKDYEDEGLLKPHRIPNLTVWPALVGGRHLPRFGQALQSLQVM